MTKIEEMDALARRRNGYLLTADVQNAGISRTYLLTYAKEKGLERAEPGIYILPETFPDPLYILQLKNREIVFSGETALYLHGLMDYEPAKVFATVKQGYNAAHLSSRGIRVYYANQQVFQQGMSFVKTPFGNEVRVYDIDRTICEMIQHKDKMDIQVFAAALKSYMSGRKKNLHQLMLYAQLLNREEAVRRYAEVLL